MKILAVDTATTSCSVAVTDGQHLVAEITLARSRTHTRHLAGMLRDVCRLAGLGVAEVDAFAVVKGPGSFTGLRIGVSTVKGLAEGAGRPIVGISALQALAEQAAAATPLVCPLIDARRGEVYFAGYHRTGGGLVERHRAQAAAPEQMLLAIDAPCTFIGNGAVLYDSVIRDRLGAMAHFAPAAAHTIRAGTVAHLAWRRLEYGESDDITTFSPDYLRKSDTQVSPRPRN
ncbi:MAG: tRNA (adenosine(37)-N6)-threonylcarbamoyltransferase complex dimerization subunit type 1 TsaB [Desulfobacterales bacterium]